MSYSITRYFSNPCNHPSPNSQLSSSISSAAISCANREVSAIIEKSKKRGHYRRYSPEERAQIGKAAHQFGIAATVRRFRSPDKPQYSERIQKILC